MSLASSSYWSNSLGRSSSVRASGESGGATTGYMDSSVKPRSSAMWNRSFVKSTL